MAEESENPAQDFEITLPVKASTGDGMIENQLIGEHPVTSGYCLLGLKD